MDGRMDGWIGLHGKKQQKINKNIGCELVHICCRADRLRERERVHIYIYIYIYIYKYIVSSRCLRAQRVFQITCRRAEICGHAEICGLLLVNSRVHT